MSSTIKNISVAYDAINEANTFSSGDYISGRITLELAKDCEIKCLLIKAKGKAEVMWTQHIGQTVVVYHSKDKYFSIKQYIIQEQEGQDCSVVAPGCHVYPFSFQIPQQDMPTSFKGSVGKVIYTLEARLSRSMRVDSKATTEFSFISKAPMDNIPDLMTPQHGTKDKKMKFFTSGTVAMDVNTERMGYYQGEGLKVTAVVQNNSSRVITPKFALYWKHSFFASGAKSINSKVILKEVGEPIQPHTKQTVTKVLNLPQDIAASILNCSILKAEYRLKVYLDVKYATDPKLKFPVVILPADQAPGKGEQPPPYSGFGNPDLEPSAPQLPAASAPYPAPPAYGSVCPPGSDFGFKS